MNSVSARSGAPSRTRRAAAVVLASVLSVALLGTTAPAALATTAPSPSATAESDFAPWTPQIASEQVPGLRLYVEPRAWPEGTDLTYQWLRDGQPIEGATGPAYGPTYTADGGAMPGVDVTASAPGYRTTAFHAAEYGPVTLALAVSPVVLRGTAAVGGTVYPGWVSGYGPYTTNMYAGDPAYAYAWKRDGQPIPGATQASYPVTAADARHALSVDVTVSFDGGAVAKTVSTPAVRATDAARAVGFDGDGTADVFARAADGTLMLYPGTGRGGWQPARAVGWGWGGFTALVAPGDFDGDGATDVMARDAAGRLYLYRGDGAGGWRGSQQIGSGWQSMKDIVAAGDFNGDGTNDILARTAADTIVLYPGDGRGGWLAPATVGWGWGGLSQLTAADMTGDHVPDVMARDASGTLRLFRGNGMGGFAAEPARAAGTGWNALALVGAPGDFNGDGDADVFGIDGGGALTMYWGNATMLARGVDTGVWKGQTTVGWGWGGFTAVF